jgi:hypothetical protein
MQDIAGAIRQLGLGNADTDMGALENLAKEHQEGLSNLSESVDAVSDTLDKVFISANEEDRNGESANVVDGLFAIACAIERLAAAVERKRN